MNLGGEEEEEEVKPTKKKKVTEEANGGKKIAPRSRVIDVDTDAENTDGSDDADEYSDSVVNKLSKVKRVRVQWEMIKKTTVFSAEGAKY